MGTTRWQSLWLVRSTNDTGQPAAAAGQIRVYSSWLLVKPEAARRQIAPRLPFRVTSGDQESGKGFATVPKPAPEPMAPRFLNDSTPLWNLIQLDSSGTLGDGSSSSFNPVHV